MKPFAIYASFALLFTSCFTYKNISRKDPITSDFLARLKPGKQYEFTLKTGQIQIIHVTSIEGETINGFYYTKGTKDKIDYSATFQIIQDNVSKISVLKHNVALTTTFSFIGALLLAAVVWYIDGWA